MRRRSTPLIFAVTMLIVSCGGGGGDGDVIGELFVATDVVVADIDGDDKNDVLTLGMRSQSYEEREGRLTVHRRHADGGFKTPVTYSVGRYPWNLTLADVNSDDTLDAIVLDADTYEVWLLPQDPANPGDFLSPRRILNEVYGDNTSVADLDGDAIPDIAIPVRRGNRVVVLSQDPEHGDFLQKEITFADAPYTLMTGDLDQDTRSDLLVGLQLETDLEDPAETVLAYRLQQLEGVLGSSSRIAFNVGNNFGQLAIGDYDGEGANDIFVFYSYNKEPYSPKLGVLLQYTDNPGVFLPRVDTSLSGIDGTDDAVFADLNNDGKPDAAVAGFYPSGSPSDIKSRVNVLFQSGGGNFSFVDGYSMPFAVSCITAGDINGDGANDLVVFGDEQPMVMHQSTATPGTFQAPQAIGP